MSWRRGRRAGVRAGGGGGAGGGAGLSRLELSRPAHRSQIRCSLPLPSVDLSTLTEGF